MADVTGPRLLTTHHAALRSALALSALVLALQPSSAQAFSKAIWGQTYRDGVNQFPLYGKLGVSIYEDSLNWRSIAPQHPRRPGNPDDPAYHWPAEIQQAVVQAKRFHMRVLLQIDYTPLWANRRGAENEPPVHPADYAAFAAAAARRYPSVHLWMVWGEPDRRANFGLTRKVPAGTDLTPAEQAAPHAYARILDAAYGSLKRVSSRNTVIGGCTYSFGDIATEQWIKNLRLPDGHPPRMDTYAHNPFSLVEPSFSIPASPFGEVQFSDLPRLARWIDRYLRHGMPIFLSEFTIPTAPDDEFPYWVEAPTAARWVTDALRLARHWRRIDALGWINVYDDPPASEGGLLTATGLPKSTYYAFQHG